MATYENVDLQDLSISENNVRALAGEDLTTEDWKDFVQSIKDHGLIEDMVVVKGATGFEVIAGRRRLIALQEIHGKKHVNFTVKLVDTPEAVDQIVISALENHRRRGLSPQEWKATIEHLKKMGLNQAKIAKKLGVSPATVSMMHGGKTWTEHNAQKHKKEGVEPDQQSKSEQFACPVCGAAILREQSSLGVLYSIPDQHNEEEPATKKGRGKEE